MVGQSVTLQRAAELKAGNGIVDFRTEKSVASKMTDLVLATTLPLAWVASRILLNDKPWSGLVNHLILFQIAALIFTQRTQPGAMLFGKYAAATTSHDETDATQA